MPYPRIDRTKLRVFPLEKRKSKSAVRTIAVDPDSDPPVSAAAEAVAEETAGRIREALRKGASVMLAFGAHLIKNGCGPVLNRMMERGWISHLATQGAGCIHDWELAFHGKTEEDVRENVASGTFGTWDETGKWIHLAVLTGALEGMGFGESVGALVHREWLNIPSVEDLEAAVRKGAETNDPLLPARAELLEFLRQHPEKPGHRRVPHPYKEYSAFGNAFRLQVPVTVHPGIGYDIITNHPMASGAALGRAAHMDYDIFVKSVLNLSGGVFLSVGSAVMAPQVFEKAMSAANNLGSRKIRDFFILVDDLQKSVWDWSGGEPDKSAPDYYLRFLKSFHRMGGTVRYAALDNRLLLLHLYRRLKEISG